MEILRSISAYIIPIILVVVSISLLSNKSGDGFSFFLDGAREGALSAIKLFPTMCALIIAVNMFSYSGAPSYIAGILSPVLGFLKIPEDIFTLIITRPISGSASLATFSEILERCGPDSFGALCASILLASSDTVIYVIGIYFSGSGIKKTRYALPLCLFVSVFCVFLSCILARLFFE